MNAGLWLLLGLVGSLLLLLLLPLRLRVRYGETLAVWGGLGLALFRIYPRKEKQRKKKPGKRFKASKKEKKDTIAKKKSSPRPLTVDHLLEWIELAKSSIGILKGLVRIRYFKLNAVIGGEDAARIALAYGGTAAALSTIYPLLESGFRLGKTDISIDASFEDKGSLTLDTEIRITPLAALVAGLRVFSKFAVIQKSQQDQQNKTTSEEAQS